MLVMIAMATVVDDDYDYQDGDDGRHGCVDDDCDDEQAASAAAAGRADTVGVAVVPAWQTAASAAGPFRALPAWVPPPTAHRPLHDL